MGAYGAFKPVVRSRMARFGKENLRRELMKSPIMAPSQENVVSVKNFMKEEKLAGGISTSSKFPITIKRTLGSASFTIMATGPLDLEGKEVVFKGQKVEIIERKEPMQEGANT